MIELTLAEVSNTLAVTVVALGATPVAIVPAALRTLVVTAAHRAGGVLAAIGLIGTGGGRSG